MDDIRIGDFIKASGTSYCAIVTGEGTTGRNTPVWKVRGPRGLSIIPKSQAVFLAPDWTKEESQ